MNETSTSRIRQDVDIREERRRHPRHLAKREVLVYWQNKAGMPCEAAAVVRNVSARGFAIELVERFPVGGAVTVRTSEGSLQCTVRHVQKQPNCFLAGLEVISISDGSRWERSLKRLSSALAGSVAK
jgi:hypothetical protein